MSTFGYPTAFNTVQNNFTIGQQVELVLMSPDGTPIQNFGLLTEFQATAQKHEIEVAGINNGGYTARRVAEKGWKGSFSFARTNGMADYLNWIEESGFYGGNPQNYYTIHETKQNNDGTLSEYQYQGVVLVGFDSGTVRQDAEVPMKIDFSAATRVPLSGPVQFS
jgi:hypothetical protein